MTGFQQSDEFLLDTSGAIAKLHAPSRPVGLLGGAARLLSIRIARDGQV